ncbi:hypothetical protein IID22_01995 [Patescibacteria group bacterium]|nr:hypothetical protein [Patescibacteria group bacterium]
MSKWVQILGARAYKVHITQGLITYGFIFIHPIFNVIITKQRVGALGSVLSLLPNFSTQREIYLTFGRIALTLLTIGVFAAYFRTKPLFRRNWRAFHILNYLAFFLVVVHSRGVGTDIRTPPFSWFWSGALVVVAGSILYKWVYPLVLRFLPVGRPSTKAAK